MTISISGPGGDNLFNPSEVRVKLTGNADYYVRTDGDDGNDGSANDAAHAWLTPQHSYDYLKQNVDPAGYDVTIHIGPGTYTGDYVLVIMGQIANIGKLSIIGDETTPSNVVFSSTGDPIAIFGNFQGRKSTTAEGQAYLGGFRLISVSRPCIYLESAWLSFGNIEFGASGYCHIRSVRGSVCYPINNYSVVGESPIHYDAEYGGQILPSPTATPVTVTFVGSPNFSSCFAYAANNGIINTIGTLWSGTVTGRRYATDTNSNILTGDNLETSLPGDVAGIKAAGGTYNGIAQRETLYAARTYYVRADGNDSNTGLVNSAGGAFLTIQKAVNAYQLLDCSGFDVTISVVDGTYSGAVSIKERVGGGKLYLTGNAGTPANVVINTTGSAFTIDGHPTGSLITISGFKFTCTVIAIIALNGSNIAYGSCEFACGNWHISAANNALVLANGNCTLSAGAPGHVTLNTSSQFSTSGSITFTISNTPAWSVAFVRSLSTSSLWFGNTTFTGSATGKRYLGEGCAVVSGGAGDDNYFPGDSAGSVANGAVYY